MEDCNDLQRLCGRAVDDQVRLNGKELYFFLSKISTVVASFWGFCEENEFVSNDGFDVIGHRHTALILDVEPDAGEILHRLGREDKSCLHSVLAFNRAK